MTSDGRRSFAVVIALATLTTAAACGDVRREPITGPFVIPDAGRGGSGGASVRPKCLANADCPAVTPSCEVSSGICGPCSADTDCRAGAPRCDRASGVCVECLDNTDCPGPGCPGAPSCPRGEAVLCHPAQRRCVECVTDGHCVSVGERCSSVLGVCATPCASPSPCPSDEPVCDPVVGFCVGCITDADCAPAAPYCRRSECTR